ncbi:PREDICTED: F-box/kelch-repeat protein At3g23880-like [Erythranthe guttata]|nr:PREDICTED: F-box/kelch-repeat protein At3g23880-like [Erythranthe guttata]|eukprot:XP_012829859.1 PREDICTED: F-box/kelch-repeat protein At3g23880-like [Erythranthe guttata]
MKTSKADRISHHLPEEIIEEILYRLPVKSLLRFKCVSQSWRSLISTKQFVETHLQHSKKIESLTDKRIISTCKNSSKSSPGRLKACSLSSLLTEPVTRAVSFDFFPLNSSRDIVIVGSCNGLISVLVDVCRFFLLNPSTREFKELPDFFTGTTCPKNLGSISGYGFGFDESSCDYKVYAVFTMTTPYDRDVGFPSKSVARVYSLKADSWGVNVFFEDRWTIGQGKFVSGKLHWINYYKTKLKWEIVCFDLTNESFGTVERPSCMEGCYIPRLGVFKGCLCMSFDCALTVGSDILIWNKYGAEDSWSELLSISYLSVFGNSSFTRMFNRVTPLFVLPSGEILFTSGSDFLIYNKKDGCVKQRHTVDFDCDRFREAEAYTESLVSLVPDNIAFF